MSLTPIDATNEVAVTSYLQQARDWLTRAVDETGPEQIAAARAEIATAAEAARQLNLSKEIRDDATEMVRRAEYAVSRSVRKAQEEGRLRTQGEGGGPRELVASSDKLSVRDIAPDLYYNGSQLAGLADIEPECFDQALEEARAEGNLSRANVARKARGQNQDAPATRAQRADVIADLAAQGYTSRQMAERVGVRDDRVRDIAREYDIDIPADRVVGKQRRIDHTAAIESAVTELDNWASSLSYIDIAEADFTEADEWVSSLTNSLTELRRFIKQIKEKTHV